MKKKNLLTTILLFCIIFFCILLFYYFIFYKKQIEWFSNNIEYYNWWTNPDSSKMPTNSVKKLFTELCENLNYDTIKIYSVFDWEESQPIKKNDKTLLIQYSGESYYKNPEWFDINIIPTNIKDRNIVIMPSSYMYIFTNNIDMSQLVKKREYIKNKSQFCLFSVSNDKCKERNQMFNELTKYKKVDSCGKYLNNIIAPEADNIHEYLDFINKYKFMICFENTSISNYFTEKLINAYIGNTIPIYWGCPNINDYVNMDAILYLPPNYTEEDMKSLINKISYLDNNEEAYKKKYESIFFKDSKIPDEFNLHKIKDKIQKI